MSSAEASELGNDLLRTAAGEEQESCDTMQPGESAAEPTAFSKDEENVKSTESAAEPTALSKDEENVKSTAMVVYSNSIVPVTFHRLDTNVDLSKPPTNWCRARSPVERYVLQALQAKKSPFSSFDMATDKLEMLDDMDVISDSENIKKLLKMPYSSAPVSLMVHRVGQTLLLDDFDIHRHLLRRQRQDWQWLRKFYAEMMAQQRPAAHAPPGGGAEQSSPAYRGVSGQRAQSRHGQRSGDKNMLSKFLYYSIQSSEETSADQQKVSASSSQFLQALNAAMADSDVAAKATEAAGEAISSTAPTKNHDKAEEDTGNNNFQRTLVWNFEDIKMLIGTDLPIFGGGSQPAVSLRLRDAATPINVLTGLEYWLDNLMCNVPEVAMCYHLNGIVQQYEKIRTEDLPRYQGSQFSPKRITDVAQNILSFLKSKAAREGHTYWLYKEGNGEVVKLYDLTSLCDSVNDAKQNPFKVPLGMLLYRLASNMLQRLRDDHRPKKVPVICGLLGNCLLLLDPDHHSQVVTSANMLLSDLYLVDYADDELSSESDEGDEQQWSSSEDEGSGRPSQQAAQLSGDKSLLLPSQVNIGNLCAPNNLHTDESRVRHFVPFPGNFEDRLSLALKHVAQALTCLDTSFERHLQSSQEGAALASGNAIPLPYMPLPHSDTQASAGAAAEQEKWQATLPVPPTIGCYLLCSSWHAAYKVLLLRNAVVALVALAEWEHMASSHEAALDHVRLALRCLASVERLRGMTRSTQCSESSNAAAGGLMQNPRWHPGQQLQLLRLCGDIHVSLAKRRGMDAAAAEKMENARSTEPYEKAISASSEKEIPQSGCEWEWAYRLYDSATESLEVAVRCYDCVLSKLPSISADAAASVVEAGSNEALATPESVRTQLTRRSANAKNELAVCYMNAAATYLCSHTGGRATAISSLEIVQSWINASRKCLEEGLAAFTAIADDVNTALLLSNSGRLLRIEAEAHAWQLAANAISGPAAGDMAANVESVCQRTEFSNTECKLYSKAVELYSKALSTLRTRNQAISEHIRSELAGTYFSWASLLQDYPPLSSRSKDEVEREFVDLAMKALKQCGHQTLRTPAVPQQSSTRCRCAAIHHRLASMYHNAYRTHQENEQKKRQLRLLAEQHYSKAAERLLLTITAGGEQHKYDVDLALELLRVQLERVALTEFLWQDHVGQPMKILKPLKGSLLIFAEDQTYEAVNMLENCLQQLLSSSTNSLSEKAPESDCITACSKLLAIASTRLRFILLQINKASSATSKKRPTEGGPPMAMRYKMLYEKALLLAKEEQAGAAALELFSKFKALLIALRSQREELGS